MTKKSLNWYQKLKIQIHNQYSKSTIIIMMKEAYCKLKNYSYLQTLNYDQRFWIRMIKLSVKYIFITNNVKIFTI